MGGLGIPDLRSLNTCLLGLWIMRYEADDDKIWKQVIVDYKYNTRKPNILWCKDGYGFVCGGGGGVKWAIKVAKMGFKWNVGNGRRVKLWEDVWLGTSSLVIQYWEICTIVNEQATTIADLCDGRNLRCTFRWCVSQRLMLMWDEVVHLSSSITLNDEDDCLIWQYNTSGIYSSQ
jgi:hypothetical protein